MIRLKITRTFIFIHHKGSNRNVKTNNVEERQYPR